jgi:putative nucleotidyltransferase with HDIG domain
MAVVEISVSHCTAGDIVAADVYNHNGLVLVPKYTVMNTFIKEKILDMGIQRIKIQYPGLNGIGDADKVEEDYEESFHLIKDTLENLASGKPLNLNNVGTATHLIMQNINEREQIIQVLNEVRCADEYTYRHCVETAFYAMLIAKWLKMTEAEIKKVIQAGLLHDIGKAKIPGEVLNKEGIITKEEYEVIQQHPSIGYEILNDFGQEIDSDVKNAVLFHHERIDRSGYPHRASADEISIYAKIIAVADVFNAMTTDRVYKKRVSPFTVFEMYQTVGLSLFDLDVINVFVKNIAPYYVGSNILLSNGEIGKVVYVPPQDLVHPIIESYNRYIDLSQHRELTIVCLV